MQEGMDGKEEEGARLLVLLDALNTIPESHFDVESSNGTSLLLVTLFKPCTIPRSMKQNIKNFPPGCNDPWNLTWQSGHMLDSKHVSVITVEPGTVSNLRPVSRFFPVLPLEQLKFV